MKQVLHFTLTAKETEDQYYGLMENMIEYKDFKTIHERWLKCFTYILRSFKAGFSKKTIEALFYDWEMENWEDLYKENSEYKDCSKTDLLEQFSGECAYICDRTSYDRLFRTHWLFRKAFELSNNERIVSTKS